MCIPRESEENDNCASRNGGEEYEEEGGGLRNCSGWTGQLYTYIRTQLEKAEETCQLAQLPTGSVCVPGGAKEMDAKKRGNLPHSLLMTSSHYFNSSQHSHRI